MIRQHTLCSALLAIAVTFFMMTLSVPEASAQTIIGSPVQGYSVNSKFGMRNHPTLGGRRMHRGIDIAAPAGTRVSSAVSGTGTVIISEMGNRGNQRTGYGNTVGVSYNNGNVVVYYNHLSSMNVQQGQTVNPGDHIGGVGTTGQSSGNHLDFQVAVRDPSTGQMVYVDPELAMEKDLSNPEHVRELIEDAKAKNEGRTPTANVGSGTGGGESGSGGGGAAGVQAGCNESFQQNLRTKEDALKQHETEAAKALITKPTSVQQLTCFDQYTKLNSEKIGKIHSDPAQGISDSIVPMVEVPNIQNLTKNFLSGIMGGGLQSMLSNAISSLGLGSLTGGGSSGNCPMMDQMWDLLQCIDFPQMPSLNDILGGKGGQLGGILSGLGDLASGKGIMGQVCSAAKDLMGGGGSGGSSVYQNAIDAMSRGYESFDDDGDNDDEQNACDYRSIARTVTDMRADLNGNNVIEASELTLIDLDQNCEISDTEIDAYLQTRSNL